jgi:phosphatidylglycerophosphatase A
VLSEYIALIRRPIHFLAFGFGAGLAAKAPGTWGTLVAVPIFIILHLLKITDVYYLAVVILLLIAGIWICGRTANDIGVHDHGGIVWDEIVGYLITLVALPMHWSIIIAGFILFRLFDIAKPWPISWLDKKVQGGLGIMLDDIVAGLFSCGILHLLLALGWLPISLIAAG